MRTSFSRRLTWHRRPNSKFPSFITRSRHHTTMSATNRNGFPTQTRIIELFYGGVKSVHIDMDYFALRLHSLIGCRNLVIIRNIAARLEWTLREPQSDNWERKTDKGAQIICLILIYFSYLILFTFLLNLSPFPWLDFFIVRNIKSNNLKKSTIL